MNSLVRKSAKLESRKHCNSSTLSNFKSDRHNYGPYYMLQVEISHQNCVCFSSLLIECELSKNNVSSRKTRSIINIRH
jgi:hypothetical protein